MNLGYRVVSSYLTDTDLSRRESQSVRGVVADSIRIPSGAGKYWRAVVVDFVSFQFTPSDEVS